MGDRPLLPLLREVLDAVPIPVLAAGGIADARTVAAAMAAWRHLRHPAG